MKYRLLILFHFTSKKNSVVLTVSDEVFSTFFIKSKIDFFSG